jgi:hypothetical protein
LPREGRSHEDVAPRSALSNRSPSHGVFERTTEKVLPVSCIERGSEHTLHP